MAFNKKLTLAGLTYYHSKIKELFTNVNNNINSEMIRATDAENTLESKKANIESPTLTGTPKAPTATDDTNTTQIATTAFVQTANSNHNTSADAHSDIRDLITGLTTRLNALADSDDTTLDQLSEIVAYIKSNRTLIENVTTSKVNVSDIVDGLTSTATDKPLSANQGKVLNDLIVTLTNNVANKVDGLDLTNHISDAEKHITSTERTNLGSAYSHSTSTHAPTNAQANVIETVKVNGTALTPNSKAVDIAVPTNVSDLVNDSGYTTNKGTVTGIKMNGASKGTSGVIDLGTVLTEHQDISGKSNVGHKHTKSEITDFPTIPSVGNGTITIKQNGTTKGSFTTNQSGNTTIELSSSDTGISYSDSEPTSLTAGMTWIGTAT